MKTKFKFSSSTSNYYLDYCLNKAEIYYFNELIVHNHDFYSKITNTYLNVL